MASTGSKKSRKSTRSPTSTTQNSPRTIYSTISTATARNISPHRTCRICLEEADVDELIAPCECRGSVKFVHPHCLQQCFAMKHCSRCQLCKTEYEKEELGLKPWEEWNWPQPLTDTWEDSFDFKCACVWLLYMSRLIYLVLRDGFQKTNDDLVDALGNGIIYRLWVLTFWINLVYYGGVVCVIGDQWKKSNSIYVWKNKPNRRATPTPRTFTPLSPSTPHLAGPLNPPQNIAARKNPLSHPKSH